VVVLVLATACGSTGDSPPEQAASESESDIATSSDDTDSTAPDSGETAVADGAAQDDSLVRKVAGLDVLWNRSLGIACNDRAGEPELGYPSVGWIVLDELPPLVGAAEAIDGRNYIFEAASGFAVGDATQHVGTNLTRPVDTVVMEISLMEAYDKLQVDWTPELQLVVVYFAPTGAALDSNPGLMAPDIGTLKALVMMNDSGDVAVATRDVHRYGCTSVHDLERQVRLWSELNRLSDEELGPWFLPDVESTEPESLANFVLSGGNDQAQTVLLRRDWMARPASERHFGESGVPPRVRQQLSGRMLAIGLPESWTEVSGSLCSRTTAGWGDECAGFNVGFNGGQIVGLRVQQFDDQPVEVMLVPNPRELLPYTDVVSLGFVSDINETNMHPVPVNGEDIQANSFAEIRELVESGQAFIGRRD